MNRYLRKLLGDGEQTGVERYTEIPENPNLDRLLANTTKWFGFAGLLVAAVLFSICVLGLLVYFLIPLMVALATPGSWVAWVLVISFFVVTVSGLAIRYLATKK